jgi:hypothetical protein
MVAPTPITAELMAIITMLQAQIVALRNMAPAAAAAPPAGGATMVFANTPQMLGTNDLIDYLIRRGSTIFKQGCKPLNDKALTDGFAMTPDQTVIFVKAFHHHATTMGYGKRVRYKLPHFPTAPVAKLTSSKVIVRGSVSLEESIPRPVQSRIT